MKISLACFVIIFFFVYVCYCNNTFNPYRVLNVAKTANPFEIRQSYLRLVKKWHTDKNSSPNAQENFIKIKQAYEVSNMLLISGLFEKRL